MGLADKARMVSTLFASRQNISTQIMAAAEQGGRMIKSERLAVLPERIHEMEKWLRAEGFTVEHIKRQEKPTGFGASLAEDGDTVTVEFYKISW